MHPLGYFDTSYGNYDVIKARLVQSGIRHIRDGVTPDNAEVIRRLNDLAASGVHSTLLFDPRSVPTPQAADLVARVRASIEAVEGPNEPNLFYADLFPDQIRQYQNGLYAALKANPTTRVLPVLSPALAFPSEIAGRLGAVACDFGAMHPYPGGQLPDAGLDDTIRATRIVAPGKPLITTETGYNTAIRVTSGQPAVSEAVQAKYISRLLLESFNRNVKRAFLYEFSDDRAEPAMQDAEQHFGLLRADGTPKPAYTAIRNLIALTSDRGAGVAIAPLTFTVSGDMTDVHYTLLRKRSGTCQWVLWVNGRSYDQDLKADHLIPAQAVNVTFPKGVYSARLHQPAAPTVGALSLSVGRGFTFGLPDAPLVIEFTPRT